MGGESEEDAQWRHRLRENETESVKEVALRGRKRRDLSHRWHRWTQRDKKRNKFLKS
jgi:hypothetical protein